MWLCVTRPLLGKMNFPFGSCSSQPAKVKNYPRRSRNTLYLGKRVLERQLWMVGRGDIEQVRMGISEGGDNISPIGNICLHNQVRYSAKGKKPYKNLNCKQ